MPVAATCFLVAGWLRRLSRVFLYCPANFTQLVTGYKRRHHYGRGQQQLLIALAMNETSGAGVTFALNGPGMLTPPIAGFGSSPSLETFYNAPVTVAAATTATVTATSVQDSTKSSSFMLLLNPKLALAFTSVPNPLLGTAYTLRATTSGGYGTDKFQIVQGALPPGLSLAQDGTLSGTPSALGTYTFAIQAEDQAYHPTGATQSFTVQVS